MTIRKILVAALFATLFAALPCALSAQISISRDEFAQRQKDFIQNQKAAQAQFLETSKSQYASFVAKRNEDYAKFMEAQWEQYQLFKGIEPPAKPYPKEPVVKPQEPDPTTPQGGATTPNESPQEESVPKPNPINQPIALPIKDIVKAPTTVPVAPQFTAPIVVPQQPSFAFEFMGLDIAVNLGDDQRFTLSDIKEKSIAQAWVELSDGRMAAAVSDCIYWKETLGLGDYMYVLMLEEMTTQFFGKSHPDQARLLKTYLLAQSGYDAKCARNGNSLITLLAIEQDVYRMLFLTIGSTKYYLIDSDPNSTGDELYTFDQKFSDQSKSCSMVIESQIAASDNLTATKTFASKRYPSLRVPASIDKNLMALYDNYPRCKWDIYAKAPMSETLAQVILPTLRAEIAGQTELEAANMLLNFVQTAFEYKTDGEYFGYERSLFVDETFYYPYSDCEDRSILYANLMRNLLGAEVVLLYYPNHLATAVKFRSAFEGDYVMVEGERYTVCDPTYIGADIGEAMPQFKSSAVEIVML